MVNTWASMCIHGVSPSIYTLPTEQLMDSNQFENDIPSDALDALVDLAYEQEQAMMEEFELNQPEVYDDQA